MRVIEISNKTYLVRHWFRWYRVQRAGTDWQPLKVQARAKDIDEIASSLNKAGHGAKLPS